MSAKTKLKEMADKHIISPPSYETVREGGTEERPGWMSTAALDDGRSATGVGRSKVEAEENAAAALLRKMGVR